MTSSDLPPTGGQQPPSPPDPNVAPPPGPSAAPGSPRHAIDEFFNRIRALDVVRPDEGRWAAGVAAGLSRRWDIDPILIRGGFVALTLFGGLGALAYGVGWLLLPQPDGRIQLQQAIRGQFTAGFIGAAVLTLIAIGGGGHSGPWRDGVWLGWGLPFGLVIALAAVAGIWWLARNPGAVHQYTGLGRPAGTPPGSPAAGSTPMYRTGYDAPPSYSTSPTPSDNPTYGTGSPAGPTYGPGPMSGGPPAPLPGSGSTGWPPPPAPGSAGTPATPNRSPRNLARERSAPSRALVRLTLGVALLAAAAILVIGHQRNWAAPVAVVAAATALAVIAVGIIVSGFIGRRAAGLVGIGLILTIVTLTGTGAHQVGVRAGQNLAVVGSQSWRPANSDLANSQFNLGVGEATLWLTNPAILTNSTPANPLRVSARIGAGHLVIVVPDNVAARLNIQIGAGEVVNPQGQTTQVNGHHGGAAQNETLTTGPAGQPRLIVQIQQGVGQLEVKTASQAATASNPTPIPTPTATPHPTATK